MGRSLVMDSSRPLSMSLLDYLWTYFGNYKVATEPSTVPRADLILTELALSKLIQKTTGGGIVNLEFIAHPTDNSKMLLIGTALDGQLLSIVDMPKEVHVLTFCTRIITQQDIDNGSQYPLGHKVLSITLSNNEEYLVDIEELNSLRGCSNSNTIVNNISNGILTSHLNIDKENNSTSLVELKTSNNGLYADVNISNEDSGVLLKKTSNGMVALIPLESTNFYIKFKLLTLAQYFNLSEKEPGTVYFIQDRSFIYLNGVKYGTEAPEGIVTNLVYNSENMTLSYSDTDQTHTIYLGPASSESNGMMSLVTYNELSTLKIALDGITNVKDYISREVSYITFSLLLDENNISLVDKSGNIISTVPLPSKEYIVSFLSKIADHEDVIEAEKLGTIINEGDYIFILTFSSGSILYVNVNNLVTIYTGKDTNSIKLLIEGNLISADLKISQSDKILDISDSGVSANIVLLQLDNTIYIYGKSVDEKYKLGEFLINSLNWSEP